MIVSVLSAREEVLPGWVGGRGQDGYLEQPDVQWVIG